MLKFGNIELMGRNQCMVNPEFYSKQYSTIMSAMDRAITFIDKGQSDAAKMLLEFTLMAAEEAYIQAFPETEPDT